MNRAGCHPKKRHVSWGSPESPEEESTIQDSICRRSRRTLTPDVAQPQSFEAVSEMAEIATVGHIDLELDPNLAAIDNRVNEPDEQAISCITKQGSEDSESQPQSFEAGSEIAIVDRIDLELDPNLAGTDNRVNEPDKGAVSCITPQESDDSESQPQSFEADSEIAIVDRIELALEPNLAEIDNRVNEPDEEAVSCITPQESDDSESEDSEIDVEEVRPERPPNPPEYYDRLIDVIYEATRESPLTVSDDIPPFGRHSPDYNEEQVDMCSVLSSSTSNTGTVDSVQFVNLMGARRRRADRIVDILSDSDESVTIIGEFAYDSDVEILSMPGSPVTERPLLLDQPVAERQEFLEEIPPLDISNIPLPPEPTPPRDVNDVLLPHEIQMPDSEINTTPVNRTDISNISDFFADLAMVHLYGSSSTPITNSSVLRPSRLDSPMSSSKLSDSSSTLSKRKRNSCGLDSPTSSSKLSDSSSTSSKRKRNSNSNSSSEFSWSESSERGSLRDLSGIRKRSRGKSSSSRSSWSSKSSITSVSTNSSSDSCRKSCKSRSSNGSSSSKSSSYLTCIEASASKLNVGIQSLTKSPSSNKDEPSTSKDNCQSLIGSLSPASNSRCVTPILPTLSTTPSGPMQMAEISTEVHLPKDTTSEICKPSNKDQDLMPLMPIDASPKTSMVSNDEHQFLCFGSDIPDRSDIDCGIIQSETLPESGSHDDSSTSVVDVRSHDVFESGCSSKPSKSPERSAEDSFVFSASSQSSTICSYLDRSEKTPTKEKSTKSEGCSKKLFTSSSVAEISEAVEAIMMFKRSSGGIPVSQSLQEFTNNEPCSSSPSAISHTKSPPSPDKCQEPIMEDSASSDSLLSRPNATNKSALSASPKLTEISEAVEAILMFKQSSSNTSCSQSLQEVSNEPCSSSSSSTSSFTGAKSPSSTSKRRRISSIHVHSESIAGNSSSDTSQSRPVLNLSSKNNTAGLSNSPRSTEISEAVEAIMLFKQSMGGIPVSQPQPLQEQLPSGKRRISTSLNSESDSGVTSSDSDSRRGVKSKAKKKSMRSSSKSPTASENTAASPQRPILPPVEQSLDRNWGRLVQECAYSMRETRGSCGSDISDPELFDLLCAPQLRPFEEDDSEDYDDENNIFVIEEERRMFEWNVEKKKHSRSVNRLRNYNTPQQLTDFVNKSIGPLKRLYNNRKKFKTQDTRNDLYKTYAFDSVQLASLDVLIRDKLRIRSNILDEERYMITHILPTACGILFARIFKQPVSESMKLIKILYPKPTSVIFDGLYYNGR